jgi:hypothetical protein
MARSTVGEYIPDDLPQTFVYVGGILDHIVQTYLTKTWHMTYTYNGDGTVATTSGWVEQ